MENKRKDWGNFFRGVVVEQYPEEIAKRNSENLKTFSLLCIAILSFSLVFGWVMRGIFQSTTEILIMWIYFLIMYIVTKFVAIPQNYALVVFYLWMVPIMGVGIIMGTFGDPTKISVTIMVFLCLVPVFILDKPWRIILFILITSIAYAICCYFAKAEKVFATDMVDLVLVTALAISANCFILRDQLNDVVNNMKLRLMAETDALTELHSRGAGVEKVSFLLEQGKSGMFLVIDCDNFKNINDNYGHVNGDAVLKAIAVCIKRSFRSSDVMMRLGGDEFAVFAQNLKSREEGEACIERMMKMVSSLSFPAMPDSHFSVSVGVSIADSENRKSFEQVYIESDQALYQAKKSSKNLCAFFEDGL